MKKWFLVFALWFVVVFSLAYAGAASADELYQYTRVERVGSLRIYHGVYFAIDGDVVLYEMGPDCPLELCAEWPNCVPECRHSAVYEFSDAYVGFETPDGNKTIWCTDDEGNLVILIATGGHAVEQDQ